jgi:hypothetical protein
MASQAELPALPGLRTTEAQSAWSRRPYMVCLYVFTCSKGYSTILSLRDRYVAESDPIARGFPRAGQTEHHQLCERFDSPVLAAHHRLWVYPRIVPRSLRRWAPVKSFAWNRPMGLIRRSDRRTGEDVRTLRKAGRIAFVESGTRDQRYALCPSRHIIRDFLITLRRWGISICLTLFGVLPFQVIAEPPTPPKPSGVFALIKAGAPTGSSILNNPDVDGISLRIGWSSVNPSEDKYDWSYFDAELAKVNKAGKKALIRVSDGGKSIPDWVAMACKAAGEPSLTFYEKAVQGGAIVTEPVFWAPTLLAKKAKLMAAFGTRYNADPTVAIVTCQFAGARNDDWNVPNGTTVDGIAPTGSTETSRWLAAGWTTAKMVNAGNQVVANAMAAFPNKPIGMAIGRTSTKLTPEGQDYIATTVIKTGRSKFGDRMFATHNNISEKAPVPPPPPRSYWRTIYDLRPSVGGQMLWFSRGDSTCRNAANGAPCDEATVLTHSVQRAHDYGWHYLEIYNADIVGLPSVIHYAHGLLAQSSPTPTSTPTPIQTPSPPQDLHGVP